jgi:twitching motility protein PilT
MQTLERALANLVNGGKVSAAEAMTRTTRPDELERLLNQS